MCFRGAGFHLFEFVRFDSPSGVRAQGVGVALGRRVHVRARAESRVNESQQQFRFCSLPSDRPRVQVSFTCSKHNSRFQPNFIHKPSALAPPPYPRVPPGLNYWTEERSLGRFGRSASARHRGPPCWKTGRVPDFLTPRNCFNGAEHKDLSCQSVRHQNRFWGEPGPPAGRGFVHSDMF